ERIAAAEEEAGVGVVRGARARGTDRADRALVHDAVVVRARVHAARPEARGDFSDGARAAELDAGAPRAARRRCRIGRDLAAVVDEVLAVAAAEPRAVGVRLR